MREVGQRIRRAPHDAAAAARHDPRRRRRQVAVDDRHDGRQRASICDGGLDLGRDADEAQNDARLLAHVVIPVQEGMERVRGGY